MDCQWYGNSNFCNDEMNFGPPGFLNNPCMYGSPNYCNYGVDFCGPPSNPSVFHRLGNWDRNCQGSQQNTRNRRKRKRKSDDDLLYDDLSKIFDEAMVKYVPDYNILRFPFITNNICEQPNTQTKQRETKNNNVCQSDNTLNNVPAKEGLVHKPDRLLMIKETNCTSRPALGPDTNAARNCGERLTITFDVSISKRTTCFETKTTEMKISVNDPSINRPTFNKAATENETKPKPLITKIVITTNKVDTFGKIGKLADSGASKDVDSALATSRSDHSQLLEMKRFEHCQKEILVSKKRKCAFKRYSEKTKTRSSHEQIKFNSEDSSSDNEKERHPNRRLELERTDNNKIFDLRTKLMKRSSKRKQSITMEPPKASKMWRNVLKNTTLWKEENLIKRKCVAYTDVNFSSYEKEESDFQEMLSEFRAFKNKDEKEMSNTFLKKRSRESLQTCCNDADVFHISLDKAELIHPILTSSRTAQECLDEVCRSCQWPLPSYTPHPAYAPPSYLYTCSLHASKQFTPGKPSRNEELAKELAATEALQWLGLRRKTAD